MKTVEEDGVVNGVKGGAEVEEEEDGEGTSVRGEEKVIGDFEKCGFCTVVCSESRLKCFM